MTVESAVRQRPAPLRLSLPAVGHPLNSELLSSLPFVLTICVMALFAHKTREPQSLARPFIRGLR